MRRKTGGFTLIELLVVVAIIGLLATLAAVAVNNARQKGRDGTRKGNISQLKNALELYYQQNGGFPQSSGSGANFDCLNSTPPAGLSTYITPVPADPLVTSGQRTTLAEGCMAYRSNGSHYKIIANMELDTDTMANDGGVRSCWYELYSQLGQSFDPGVCPP